MRTLDGVPAPRLPEGYRLSSLAEGVDLHRLNRCLHRGFGHPDPVVCTEPGHRRRGLARAAVQESLRRAAALGAHTAYVGSDLPLYRDLGFAAFHRSHWWRGRVG